MLGVLEQEAAKAVEGERSEGVSQGRAFPGGADERTKRTSPSPSAAIPPTNSLAPLECLPGVPTVSWALCTASHVSFILQLRKHKLSQSPWPKMALQVNCKHWISGRLGGPLPLLCLTPVSTGERTNGGTLRAAEMVN